MLRKIIATAGTQFWTDEKVKARIKKAAACKLPFDFKGARGVKGKPLLEFLFTHPYQFLKMRNSLKRSTDFKWLKKEMDFLLDVIATIKPKVCNERKAPLIFFSFYCSNEEGPRMTGHYTYADYGEAPSKTKLVSNTLKAVWAEFTRTDPNKKNWPKGPIETYMAYFKQDYGLPKAYDHKLETAEKVIPNPGLLAFLEEHEDKYRYNDKENTLLVKGRMTAEERKELLGLFAAKADQEAINRLFERSHIFLCWYLNGADLNVARRMIIERFPRKPKEERTEVPRPEVKSTRTARDDEQRFFF